MDNEIFDFIQRRFTQNCEWDSGNCWWFAAILCTRFKELEIWYEPVEGHFYASENGTIFYDWRGAHFNMENKPIPFKDIEKQDHLWHNRIIRDCII